MGNIHATFFINVRDVVRYLVTGGRDIRVEPRGGGDHDISAFPTGRVFAALLQQHDLTTFHASVVVTETGAVLFEGRSGIGKSSLLDHGSPHTERRRDEGSIGRRRAAHGLSAFPCMSLQAAMEGHPGFMGTYADTGAGENRIEKRST